MLLKLVWLQKITKLTLYILEILRLHSIAPLLERKCAKDYKVDDNLTIEKGMSVWIPIGAIHRDANYYEDPLSFIPERFNDELKHPLAWTPFGAGPRNCIGELILIFSLFF